MRIIVNNIDKLLTSSFVKRRTFIDIIDTIDKKIDIKTKNENSIDKLSWVYYIIYMSIMSIICQWYVVFVVNNLSIPCQYVNNYEGV